MKGIGMDGEAIPLLCGGVFSTSKNQGNQSTVGKYGVGLKAILLYYHSILSVSSSTRRQSNVTSYRLRMDPGVAREFSSRHPEEEGHSQTSRIERLVKWHSHHHQSRHRRPLSLRSACERVRFQTHRADTSLSSPCSNPRRVSVGLCLFLTTLSCVAPSLSLFQSGIRIQHGFVPADFSAPLALVLRLLSAGPIRAGLFRHGDSLLLFLRRRNSVVRRPRVASSPPLRQLVRSLSAPHDQQTPDGPRGRLRTHAESPEVQPLGSLRLLTSLPERAGERDRCDRSEGGERARGGRAGPSLPRGSSALA